MSSAILDACVLYPAALRDFLLQLVEAEVFRGHMTRAILDECFWSILRKRPDLSPEKLARTREAMEAAFADLMIEGHEPLIAGLTLPDPDDRHVLAAAIHEGVPIIITFNLRDFPAKALAPHGVVAIHPDAIHPDAFVSACVDTAPETVVGVVEQQARGLRNPPTTVNQMLDRIEAQGLPNAVAAMRRQLR